MEFLDTPQEHSQPTHKVHICKEEASFMNISIHVEVI